MAEATPPQPVRAGGAVRNTLLALLTQVATGGFTAILTVYLVRALGPREFGLFSLALSIGAVAFLPSDFGISSSAARFIAERFGDSRAVAALMATAVRLKLMISGAASALMIALAGPIASAYGEPSLAWPLRWVAIAVLGQGLVAFYRYAFMAMRDASVGLRIVVGESAVEVGASIVLVVLGGGAAGAAAGRAAGYGFGTLLAVALTLRRLGMPAFARPGRAARAGARGRLARYGGALFAIDAAFTGSVVMAPLMIGGFLGARAVGLFQAPARLIVLLQYPGVAMAYGLAPRMARGEDHEPEVELFTTALRYLIVLQALIVAAVVVWARPIVDLALGAGYGRSAELLRQLGPYVFASGLSGLVSLSVNYLGEARRRVPFAIADLALTAALNAALLSTIGLSGAAWAADVVSVGYVGVHIWIVRSLVDVPLRPLALALLRGLAAAAAMAAVLFAFGTGHLAAWQWVAGLTGGVLAFAAVVVVTGEVSRTELRELALLVLRRARATTPA
jgi:O-antigen/teichoic acid export membrane protein